MKSTDQQGRAPRKRRLCLVLASSVIAVTLVLPMLLAVWGTSAWLAQGALVHSARASHSEWAKFLVVSWGSLAAMAALLVGFVALGIRVIVGERLQPSLWLAFGAVLSSLAAAFLAGAVGFSRASGAPIVPDRIPTPYWFWAPGFAAALVVLASLFQRADKNDSE